MSELLFIAVPGGKPSTVIADHVLLRVLVMPRLDAGTVAGNGLADWPPAQLRQPLQVIFQQDHTVVAQTPISSTPRLRDQPGIWPTFFALATVGAPRGPGASDQVVVDPTSQHATAISQTYQSTAQTISGHDAVQDAAAFQQMADDQLAAYWAAPPTPAAPPGSAPESRDARDFNQILGRLREHPTVLSALGLILELDIPVAALPTYSAGIVSVTWPAAAEVTPAVPPVVSRWTKYERDTFLPATDLRDLQAGMVRLDDTARWGLITVDVDSAVGRLRDAAATGADTGAGGLPALRTTGLSLVRGDRATDFAQRRQRSTQNADRAAHDLPDLTADDLTLGYRIDVTKGDSNVWFPLCRRTAPTPQQTMYTVDGVPIGSPGLIEEGHVKAHSAARDDTHVLRADEIVTRWDGWSLVVPNPTTDRGGTPANNPAQAYHFVWDFAVPEGSLPKLRFGSVYQVRARVADIAGGGLEFDDPFADRNRTVAKTFARHEPVPSPVLSFLSEVDTSTLSPGVHVDQLVLRSVGGPQHFPLLPSEVNDVRRMLSAGLGSPTLAERHGLLDNALPSRADLPDPASHGVAAFSRLGPDGPPSTIVSDQWLPAWPSPDPKEIVLTERSENITPVLVWRPGGHLIVTLDVAEEIVVELSSTLPDEFRLHFDVTHSVSSQGTVAAIGSGRHPLVTPARTITCVHAVKAPLSSPTGNITAHREEGQAVAGLAVSPALLGIDVPSTGQLDISAAWVEVDDNVRTRISQYPVQSILVHRGDREFAEPMQHNFPDTKHREVHYTATAISRFRAFFDDAAPEADFRAAVALPEVVSVPSTARPAPPVVRSVVPAFTWSENRVGSILNRLRHGGRVRVELARPWFSTGDGEQLAVIVADGDLGQPDSAWPPITQVGLDPIHYPPSGTGYSVPAHIEFRDGIAVEIPETWVSTPAPTVPRRPGTSSFPGSATTATMPATGMGIASIGVAAHDVWLAGDSWYADIAIGGIAEEAYCPFIQLALARYQPHSLDGLCLSPVVLSDFVPLLPDRELSINFAGDHVLVTLAGLGQTSRVDVIVEHGAGAPDMLVAVGADSSGAWRAVEGGVVTGSLGETMTVPLPAVRPLRIRVREVELVGTGPAAPTAGTPDELTERTIFTDIVPVP